MGVEIEVHEGGRESEEQREREESGRGGGKEACVYSLHSAQLPTLPEFRSLDGKPLYDQEGRSKAPDLLFLPSLGVGGSRVRMKSTFG